MPDINLSKKGQKTTSKPKSIPLKSVKVQPPKTQASKVQPRKTRQAQTPTQQTPPPQPQQPTQTQPTQQPPPATPAPQNIQTQSPATHTPQQPQPQQNAGAGWDNWGTDAADPFSGLGTGYGGQNTRFGAPTGRQPQRTPPPKRQTPEERVQMIKKVYSEILGREPDTRDINYYKYSTLNEDQIKKQLLTSAEHKYLIKKGREYDKLKNQTDQAKTQAKMLEGQIKDQIEEFKQLNILLKEKNDYIQKFRKETATTRTNNKPSSVPQCIQSQQAEPATKPIEIEDLAQTTTTKIPPPPPIATFTDELQPGKSKSGGRIKEVLTQFLSQFF